MGKKLVIILLVVAVLIGGGIWKLTSVVTKAGELGGVEVDKFHAQYNEGKDAEMYAGTSQRFRDAVKLDELQGLNGHLRTKLGKVTSAQRTGIEVNNNNGDKILQMTYAAAYQKGPGTVSFAYDYNGEKPLLIRFDVQSDLLKSKQPEKPAEEKPAEKPLEKP